MFIFFIRTVVLAVAVFASSISSAANLSAQSELLCSPEGLMRLIPQFNVNGRFTIPNPNALTPVPLSQGSMYVIKQSNPTYPALVYPMPTSHPCVNRLFLAADDTAGFWPTPTYSLGRYQLDNNGLPMRDKPLITYLIVIFVSISASQSLLIDNRFYAQMR